MLVWSPGSRFQPLSTSVLQVLIRSANWPLQVRPVVFALDHRFLPLLLGSLRFWSANISALRCRHWHSVTVPGVHRNPPWAHWPRSGSSPPTVASFAVSVRHPLVGLGEHCIPTKSSTVTGVMAHLRSEALVSGSSLALVVVGFSIGSVEPRS